MVSAGPPAGLPMSTVRVIKRYANRKLYDTERSCYVTLEELGALVREGHEIRIVDNQTKEDLTSVTMAQILVEEEKRNRRNRPLASMRNLIEHSGELIQRRITEPVQNIRTSVEESVNRLLEYGEERAQALEELQTRLDDRVRQLRGSVALLGHLQREMSTLRARLERVEAHLGLTPPAGSPDDAVAPDAETPAEPPPPERRPRR